MYIDPFWAGVGATIVTEVLILIVTVGIGIHNDKKK